MTPNNTQSEGSAENNPSKVDLSELRPLIEVIDRSVATGKGDFYYGSLGSKSLGSSVHLVPIPTYNINVRFFLGNLESAVDLEFLVTYRIRAVINCCGKDKRAALDSLSACTGESAAEVRKQLQKYVTDTDKFYEDHLIKYLELAAEDKTSYDISQHFESCCGWVEAWVKAMMQPEEDLSNCESVANDNIANLNSLNLKKESKAEARRRRREEASANSSISSSIPGLLIHCGMGVNRSAAILAAVLIRCLKSTGRVEIERIAKARPIGILSNRNFLRAVDRFSVKEFSKNINIRESDDNIINY